MSTKKAQITSGLATPTHEAATLTRRIEYGPRDGHPNLIPIKVVHARVRVALDELVEEMQVKDPAPQPGTTWSGGVRFQGDHIEVFLTAVRPRGDGRPRDKPTYQEPPQVHSANLIDVNIEPPNVPYYPPHPSVAASSPQASPPRIYKIAGMDEYVAKHGSREITVCAECQRACCWQGAFMCDEAYGANIKTITITEAAKLALEHFDYWTSDADFDPSENVPEGWIVCPECDGTLLDGLCTCTKGPKPGYMRPKGTYWMLETPLATTILMKQDLIKRLDGLISRWADSGNSITLTAPAGHSWVIEDMRTWNHWKETYQDRLDELSPQATPLVAPDSKTRE